MAEIYIVVPEGSPGVWGDPWGEITYEEYHSFPDALKFATKEREMGTCCGVFQLVDSQEAQSKEESPWLYGMADLDTNPPGN